MDQRTRYGDLTRQAALHLTAAAAIVTSEPLRGLPAASPAAAGFADLHDAPYRLGWQLRGGPVAHVLAPGPARRDSREAATPDLLEQVGRTATRSYSEHIPRTGVAGQRHRAAVQLRANDLLATHRTPLGRPRGPDTPDFGDPVVAGPAWREYAALVQAAASVTEPLATRARTAGVAASRLRGLPWAGDRLTLAAEQLRLVTAPSSGTALDDLEVANPTVRAGDPLLELSDRMQQMHAAVWLHTRRGTMSVASLTDLAVVAAMVHAAAHRALTAEPDADRATLDMVAVHGTRGARWMRLWPRCAASTQSRQVSAEAPTPSGNSCPTSSMTRDADVLPRPSSTPAAPTTAWPNGAPPL